MISGAEKWLPVRGFEGFYEVSDLGRVRSLDRWVRTSRGEGRRKVKGRILRPGTHHWGYAQVNLSAGGRTRMRPVHRLVMEAFVPEGAGAGMVVCHGGKGLKSNRLEDLEWGTQRKNSREDRIRDGTLLLGEKAPNARLTESDVLAIRKDPRPQKEIAAEYGIAQPTVSDIKRRRRWRHLSCDARQIALGAVHSEQTPDSGVSQD